MFQIFASFCCYDWFFIHFRYAYIMASFEKVSIPKFPFTSAVQFFWTRRSLQNSEHKVRGGTDTSTRSTVTGGKHMDGFITQMVESLKSAGVDDAHILFRSSDTRLPGFYRPTKSWDLLVVSGSNLLAAVEVKSQVGSVGNNMNNRFEEALGNSRDFWAAYDAQMYGNAKPFLGYLYLLEDDASSHHAVRIDKTRFSVDDIFLQSSYADRLRMMCQRLVLNGDYTAAAALYSDRKNASLVPNYTDLANNVGGQQFLEKLVNHVVHVLETVDLV